MKLVKTSVFSAIRLVIFSVLLSVLGISALSLLKVGVKSAEASENIVAVGNNSYALNNWTNAPRRGQTGYSYTYVSGGLDVPLIFTQVLNPSDPEQQWNRWKLNNGYYMLQNKANGLCATIRTVMDRGEISMEGCDTNRAEQYLSGGFFQLSLWRH